MTYCILAPDSLYLLMWKLPANYEPFKQQTFQNQQNLSIWALSVRALFSQRLSNYFTSIIRIFPLENLVFYSSCFHEIGSLLSSLDSHPREHGRRPAGQSISSTDRRTPQSAAREGGLSWLAGCVAAPDAGAVPFFRRKEAFTHLWARYLADCHGTHCSTSWWPFAQSQQRNANINASYKRRRTIPCFCKEI